jgi:hypothetical protein
VATTRQIGIPARPIVQIAVPTWRAKLLQNYFYFSMSLLIAATVVYGFSHTVNENLRRAPLSFICTPLFSPDGCSSSSFNPR